jgi:hypothetical protein
MIATHFRRVIQASAGNLSLVPLIASLRVPFLRKRVKSTRAIFHKKIDSIDQVQFA